MPGDFDRDVLGTLLQRAPVLRALSDGPRRKPDLVSTLDVSRSTVDRAIRELENLELVERVDGGFRVTLAGQLALQSLDEFTERIHATTSMTDMLRHFEPDAALTLDALVGADLLLGAQPAPYQIANKLESFIEGAESLRVLTQAISNSSSAEVIAQAVFDGTDYEAVFATDLARFLCQNRSEERRRMVETGHFRAYSADEIPCNFLLIERSDRVLVVIVVYDDEDILRGMIVNDTEAAVEWAEDLYERYRSQAREVTAAMAGEAPGEEFSFHDDGTDADGDDRTGETDGVEGPETVANDADSTHDAGATGADE